MLPSLSAAPVAPAKLYAANPPVLVFSQFVKRAASFQPTAPAGFGSPVVSVALPALPMSTKVMPNVLLPLPNVMVPSSDPPTATEIVIILSLNSTLSISLSSNSSDNPRFLCRALYLSLNRKSGIFGQRWRAGATLRVPHGRSCSPRVRPIGSVKAVRAFLLRPPTLSRLARQRT